MDSTIVEVHGRAKQGAAFGYNNVRGYPPQLATSAQTGQLLMSQLPDAASFLTETISRVRGGGGTGQLIVRADSAFYSGSVISTAAKFDVRFVVLDPLAAFLVVLRRHWGVALAVAVLTTDAVASSWADYVPLSSPGVAAGRVGQGIITVLAICACAFAPRLWQATAPTSGR